MRADRASVLTRITALYVDKVATPVLEPFGLSLAQYKIVGYLYRAPEGTVTTALTIFLICAIIFPIGGRFYGK